MRNIFITGATGFLGRYLLKEFLDNEDIAPSVLVRNKNNESPTKRIEKILQYFYGTNYKVMLKRIKIIEGEVDKKSLGIDNRTKEFLINNIDEIFHSAAIAEFRVPLKEIRKVNVEGTRNVMDFAVKCKNKGKAKKVNHISTVCVAGNMRGIFYENELDVEQKFNNTYEQSKFEAELLVREYKKNGLNVTIFRPSILTGDSVSGKTSNFKMFYQPLHFFAAEIFKAIPADKVCQFNLIPVNSAARAIRVISNEKGTEGITFHIANTMTVSGGHFIDVASDYIGFKKPVLIPVKDFDMRILTPVQKELIEPYISYLNYNPSFDLTNARKVLERKKYNYPIVDDRFFRKLFKFCIESRFIKSKKSYVIV